MSRISNVRTSSKNFDDILLDEDVDSRQMTLYLRNIPEYEEWLIELVGDDGREHRNLLKYLNDWSYSFEVSLDRNRENDVDMLLRPRLRSIISRSLFSYDAFDTPSILEVLIALCIRFSDEIGEELSNGKTLSWKDLFWDALDNSGLSNYTDTVFDIYGDEAKESLSILVEKLNSREYEPNGKGGYFPLKNSSEDLRKVDLWRQLGLYVSEKYPL